MSFCLHFTAHILFQAFKKDKKVQKGIAFPCCVSVNNCICHFSPMNSDPDVTLKVWLVPRFKSYENVSLAIACSSASF